MPHLFSDFSSNFPFLALLNQGPISSLCSSAFLSHYCSTHIGLFVVKYIPTSEPLHLYFLFAWKPLPTGTHCLFPHLLRFSVIWHLSEVFSVRPALTLQSPAPALLQHSLLPLQNLSPSALLCVSLR